MVKIKECDYILVDGTINIQAWLQNIAYKQPPDAVNLIGQACILSQLTGGDQSLYQQHTCLQQGIRMAELLLDLNVDQTTIAAAILYNNVEYGDLSLEDITEQLGPEVAKLISGTQRMEAVHSLVSYKHGFTNQNRSHIDNLRKMLLAMVEDVRVVLIKLAERTCMARTAIDSPPEKQKLLAQEILNVYAPLANRLGIGQIKWELEDLSLRYLEPKAYSEIAKLLDSRRVDRERYIQQVITILKQALAGAGIKNFEISGRAKHIYSIYRKMQRKEVHYSQIYDVSAVRVLVPDVADCYEVLSCVSALWQQIPEEFDDYINNPKPNGYRSLHMALIGPEAKNVEVQIRTYDMHQESELGVAAHWKYKEGSQQQTDYENKIAWLRQVLAWQKELAQSDEHKEQPQAQKLFEDRVYVFTPDGDIKDLPKGATPLDFAYMVHSEVGHRCRGAKINSKIVPLTYQLQTGDRVEILTQKYPNPSRDWLNPHSHYLVTPRAKAKVHHWFKQQDHDKKISEGQHIIEQELKRQGPQFSHLKINFEKVARKLKLKTATDIYLGLSNGDLRPGQVINTIQALLDIPKDQPSSTSTLPESHFGKTSTKASPDSVKVEGVDELLSFFARCCKPVPGDKIIGYITRGRGISIHRQDCQNIIHGRNPERLINVSWSGLAKQTYPVDVRITAHDRQGLVKDILAQLTHDKISLLGLTTNNQQSTSTCTIFMTIEIDELDSLQYIFQHLQQLPDVINVERHHQY